MAQSVRWLCVAQAAWVRFPLPAPGQIDDKCEKVGSFMLPCVRGHIASTAIALHTLIKKNQVGVPSVPSAVFRGSIQFEDFRCDRHVKVSKCVTSNLILN
jgi:hypothetical protein